MSDSGNAARAVISGSYGAMKMRELQIEIYRGEIRDHIEHIEPYGFTSEPEVDKSADAFVLFFGGDRSHGVVICAANRRFRPTDLKTGDVVLYDKRKHEVRLQDGKITITSPDDLEAHVTGNLIATVGQDASVSVQGALSAQVAGAVDVTSQAQVTIKAPTTTIDGQCVITGGLQVQGQGAQGAAMQCTGNMQLDGSMSATSDVTASGISLMTHVHSGVQTGGGNTGAPH